MRLVFSMFRPSVYHTKALLHLAYAAVQSFNQNKSHLLQIRSMRWAKRTTKQINDARLRAGIVCAPQSRHDLIFNFYLMRNNTINIDQQQPKRNQTKIHLQRILRWDIDCGNMKKKLNFAVNHMFIKSSRQQH